MRLTVVGCSPAWPNPGGAQSGYLVHADGAVLLDCGAYSLSQASQYNGRPLPAVVLVSESGEVQLIRKRDELEDLALNEVY